MKTALITGITGQDGNHLAALLLGKGYEVTGMVDGTDSQKDLDLLSRLPKIKLVTGNLGSTAQINSIIAEILPDEIYNLGALTFVGKSFEEPENTVNITGLGAIRVLDAVKQVQDQKSIRVYQASSSEMFGDTSHFPQNEETPFSPRSPYGYAKVLAHHACVNYRSAFGIHASSGILFNHEGEFRGEEFVTRKITKNVAKIKLGKIDRFSLGSLEPKRDWGYAGDYVEAMWLMLQQDNPGDYVISTGQSHSVREFLQMALDLAGLDKDLASYVDFDPSLIRPTEVNHLLGDSTKAKKILGWEPKTRFSELVKLMLDHDLKIEECT
ncbi:MAG: NAD-dependent epimerase/dehydratase family protein [Actinobacteria bacterium]|uniref:GDP-mannose 4,6-dehydratase n=1 Tax=freshwater metagenome TaxID=449393 RepID=A0A6J6RLS5_9ZZZZ|nr:NAD-dependent epimerase/dehydratase family protein [Actinomycetota bacterium]MSX45482.1 NAD-dependent epimerase/dehydratase family protein [Actinomycetota bacterium]MSX71494.1 NAD-dependent epimerase/dehydratase family protein [Actinomycetota bacterium]MSY69248.1 NAD-dependent epimerase/dehydratase family protein [Actinomycetota bacterium]MTA75429.1 NAD-dependent epimerase/dehydratase family protein [Actinomycetota bacterium]